MAMQEHFENTQKQPTEYPEGNKDGQGYQSINAEGREKLQLAEKPLFMCKLGANLPTHAPSNKPLFWPPLA